MGGVAVVTDSTASLSSAAARDRGVRVVPLQVVLDGVSRPEAGPGAGADAVTSAEVVAALRAGARVTTSRPAAEVFAILYATLADEGYTAVVSAHLSAEISGTVAAAEVAAVGAPVPVAVVDTRTVGMAAGFAVLAGAEVARSGASADQVAATVESRAAAATIWFSVATLEHLRRGGRIGAAAALLGSALAVKPLLTVREGVITAAERVRTASRARARLEELGLAALAAAAGSSGGVEVAVHHLDDATGAERLADRLRDRVPSAARVELTEVSAVLGVHTGPGTLGIVVAPRSTPPLGLSPGVAAS